MKNFYKAWQAQRPWEDLQIASQWAVVQWAIHRRLEPGPGSATGSATGPFH